MYPFNSPRGFLRFLWLKDIQNEPLITLRFTCAIFGSASSQFLLASVIRKHLETYKKNSMSQFVVSFLKYLYVDGSINGGDKETEVLNFYENASKIMLEAGFELRKQQTNSEVVRDYINSDNSMASDELKIKVLRLSWLLENDEFALDVSNYLKNVEDVPHTKRNILKFIVIIFDPAVLISPVLINLIILFQKF